MPSTVQLLGVPGFVRSGHRNGPREDIPPGQALLLVAYLAYGERWLSRPAVAGFFWPDKSEKAARHSLNQLLYSCRKLPWAAGLEVERSRLRWTADTDLARFRASVAQGDWRDAVERYRGEFLASVDASVSAEVEAWLGEARRELHGSWRDAARAHSEALVADAEHAAAAELLERILQRDELAEDALQRLLLCGLELGGGARRRALERFERFERTLRDELSVEPAEATLELVDALRAKPGAPVASPPVARAPKPTLANAPSYDTGFIGRDAEQADLDALLSRPDVRLVTLLGPGGVGKTRLAVHVAAAQARRFAHGAAYVPLAALDDAERVPSAVLSALGLEGSPDVPIRDQVLDHLRGAAALLVFDNVESVIDAAELIHDILDAAPESRALATSREALELPGEHLYDLPGLNFPETPDDLSEDYDAVRLFVRSAQRFRSAFALDEETRPPVLELCRLLEGSPLGLELAASWLRLLTAAEIVHEVRASLDFLATRRADLPPRHRSLRAVFDYSWQLLSDEERRALARLSVFRGGFDRDAAAAVAEVPARTLLSLVNKSLLQRTRNGRFERHATVRAFSAERLADEERPDLLRRHAAHVAELAAGFRDATLGPQAEAWLERLRTEIDNVRAALGYTLDAPAPEVGLRIAGDLNWFWYRAGLVSEGEAFLTALLALPLDAVPARLRALGSLSSGELHRLAGDTAAARERIEHALQLFLEIGDETNATNALNSLGIAAYVGGDRAAARRAWRDGLARAERRGDTNAVANLSTSLGFLAKDDGDHEAMTDLFGRALAIYEAMGHRFAIMTTKSNLGFAALHRGDVDASLRHQREALTMALELEHDDSIVRCLEDIAALAAVRGEAALALQLAAASAAQRAALSLPIEAPDRASLEGYLEAARAALDEASAERAAQRGATMDLREAAGTALELAPGPGRADAR